MTELATGAADGTAVDLSWLMGALELARTQDQTRAVGYLEAIADDVVFEWSRLPTGTRNRRG